MNKISTPHTALLEQIRLLEQQQQSQIKQLGLQFQNTYQSLKPVNIFKNAILDVASSSAVKNSLWHNVVGMASGSLVKFLLVGQNANFLKNIAGTLVQFGIANVVSKSDAQSKD